MGEFNSDDHYFYYSWQESLRRNAVAIIEPTKESEMQYLDAIKNDRMISVRFQDKPFNITVIQVYAPTSNAEEVEVEWFYEDLQDLLKLTPKKDVLFMIGCCCCCYVALVMSDSVRPHRWQPTRLPIPGILQARTLEWGAIAFSVIITGMQK